MTEPRQFPVIMLGAGHVGRAFLTQIRQTRERLAERYGIGLRPVAVADSSGAVVDPAGLSMEALISLVERKNAGNKLIQQPGALEIGGLDLIKHCLAAGIENAIVVDTTDSETGELLRYALAQGYSLALANKHPLADFWTEAHVLFESPRVRFEATVGAGLPVIATLRYLVDTGDVIQHIEGSLSSTLGYLCTHLEDGEALSLAVNRAKARGYTEPAPREDLSGKDVARKALILARIAGWHKELEDLRIDPLFPIEMAELPVHEFLAELPRLDADMAAYIAAFGGVPRYMCEISQVSGIVGLRMVSETLAAQLRGTLNLISFTTACYADVPLTLIGPGAGLAVAAAAVLQDCISLAISTPANNG